MGQCEKFDGEFPNFKYCMILTVNIANFQENQWVTCFQESAEAILGQNTVYLGELKEKVGCVFVSMVMCLPGATELLHACFGCGVCALTALSENLTCVLCVCPVR